MAQQSQTETYLLSSIVNRCSISNLVNPPALHPKEQGSNGPDLVLKEFIDDSSSSEEGESEGKNDYDLTDSEIIDLIGFNSLHSDNISIEDDDSL